MRLGPRLLYWCLIVAIIAVSGVVFAYWQYGGGPWIGATFALCICLPILAFEQGFLFQRLQAWMQGLPTPGFIGAAILTYVVMMAVSCVLVASLLWWLGVMDEDSWLEVATPPPLVMIYALAICATVVFVRRVRELLGRDVFTSLLISRYRKPVREERVFLFIDLVGSTAFAEEFGDLRAQQFLGALFASFAKPVDRNYGIIDDYVGDCAIITWPMARGIKDASCVNCVFDILARIEARADLWRTQYGQVPQLRAALHGGEVVTAEIGINHHKITYFGDTVNTTARLEGLCRTLDVPVLISTDLAERMTLPPTIETTHLGEHALRGRGQTLGVMALRRAR